MSSSAVLSFENMPDMYQVLAEESGNKVHLLNIYFDIRDFPICPIKVLPELA